ncbi:MAG TPA: YggS family pyridoxal phosphate-dependent enzyme [Terriglobia bacterium]|nr:YggS family pyridoxal phosphate-dependent enzyme [Terriglobia bacterium]
MEIKENIEKVRDRMAAACRRSGRSIDDVKLVAITKTVPPDRVQQAWEAGIRDFGENRVQEARGKIASLAGLPATWHLVGHLQTNKAKAALELFEWIHSIDSLRLAQRLERLARDEGKRLRVLLEVNLGGEPTKSGVSEAALTELVTQIAQLRTLDLCGLMTIPPFFASPEDVRPCFRRLRHLAAEINSRQLPNVRLTQLSMGMSHDFEVAIEEGATMVRIGTAIFGSRP